MVYQTIQRSQQERSQAALKAQPKEYVVILLTTEVDSEYEAPFERIINVAWDAGIIPDWDYWLKLYIQDEEEDYRIDEIIEIDPDAEYEI